MSEKTYTIAKHRRGRVTETTGTLAELIKYFRYTLESGNGYNSRISVNPRTAKTLVSNLNKAVDELQRDSFDPNYYELR